MQGVKNRVFFYQMELLKLYYGSVQRSILDLGPIYEENPSRIRPLEKNRFRIRPLKIIGYGSVIYNSRI